MILRVVLVEGLLHLSVKLWVHGITQAKGMLTVELSLPVVVTNGCLVSLLLHRLLQLELSRLLLVLRDRSNSLESLLLLDIKRNGGLCLRLIPSGRGTSWLGRSRSGRLDTLFLRLGKGRRC